MSTATRKRELETIPECNGWRNYPTWCVNLWLTNDQGLDEQVREMAQDVADMPAADLVIEGTSISRERASVLADHLKGWVECDLLDVSPNGFQGDLCSWAFAHVDWYELAEHYLTDTEPRTVPNDPA